VNINKKLVYSYRIVAKNTAGYGGAFPSVTAQSMSNVIAVGIPPDAAPTNLTAVLQAGPQIALSWQDNSTNEAVFVIERSTDGVTFTEIARIPGLPNTGKMSYIDTTVTAGATDTTYSYRVAAANAAGMSAYTNTASAIVPAMPAAPSNLVAANGPDSGNRRSVVLTWVDNSTTETGFTIQYTTDSAFAKGITNVNVAANTTTYTITGLSRNTNYYIRIRANNGTIIFSSWVNAAPLPILTNP
jgi:hypothetical protein